MRGRTCLAQHFKTLQIISKSASPHTASTGALGQTTFASCRARNHHIGETTEHEVERRASVQRFVQSDRRRGGRGKAPAIYGGRSVARNRCADQDVCGNHRIDCDRANRAIADLQLAHCGLITSAHIALLGNRQAPLDQAASSSRSRPTCTAPRRPPNRKTRLAPPFRRKAFSPSGPSDRR